MNPLHPRNQAQIVFCILVMKAAIVLMSLAEAGMEVTARLAEQSAECSVALCQMLGTPLLQQHSSSSPPPPHHHHINSIPSPSSPSTVHSLTDAPTNVASSCVPSRCCVFSQTPCCSCALEPAPNATVFLPMSHIKDTHTHWRHGIGKKKKSTLKKSHSLECLLSFPSSVAARMRKRLLHTVGRSIRILSDL